MLPEFKGFDKISRLTRECVVTEKIDGTNAQIHITDDGEFYTGSRNKWITPQDDNAGFSRWAHEHKDELMTLGPGSHFGEWWGKGIQRGYGLIHKSFSLFNVARWEDDTVRPKCCNVVPVLYKGIFDTTAIEVVLRNLGLYGSSASPGFMNPEGIVIWHEAARVLFKKTLLKDEAPKGKNVSA